MPKWHEIPKEYKDQAILEYIRDTEDRYYTRFLEFNKYVLQDEFNPMRFAGRTVKDFFRNSIFERREEYERLLINNSIGKKLITLRKKVYAKEVPLEQKVGAKGAKIAEMKARNKAREASMKRKKSP